MRVRSNIGMFFRSTVAESRGMENDTALHSPITYLPLCWGELFTLQSSIRIHAISTRARELSGRGCYMPSRPPSSPGATMGAGNPIIRVYSATSRPQPSPIFTIRLPIEELRWSSLMAWQASGENAASNLVREFVLKRFTSHGQSLDWRTQCC